MTIDSHTALRTLYPPAKDRARQKQLAALDAHCRRFIALSPFAVLATTDAAHHLDASPRGGEPGFVKVSAAGELLIGDSPGNNRLDSFENIVATGGVGLLFLIPGVDETLRVNGRATLSTDPADIAACTTERRAPKLVLRIAVQEAYLHCAKALMRAKLWDAQTHVDRSALPTTSEMINEQTGVHAPLETQDEMARRYAPDL